MTTFDPGGIPTWARCATCGGRGELEIPPERAGRGETWAECATCHGSGVEPCECGRGAASVDRGAMPAICQQCQDDDDGRRRYVNAYEVARLYGGPEEGGWYYDAGTPLASVPVENHGDQERERGRLRAMFAPDYEDERDRHSAAGGNNLEIYIEDEPAAPFPTTRPHYE